MTLLVAAPGDTNLSDAIDKMTCIQVKLRSKLTFLDKAGMRHNIKFNGT